MTNRAVTKGVWTSTKVGRASLIAPKGRQDGHRACWDRLDMGTVVLIRRFLADLVGEYKNWTKLEIDRPDPAKDLAITLRLPRTA
jgi:hypothetical protein